MVVVICKVFIVASCLVEREKYVQIREIEIRVSGMRHSCKIVEIDIVKLEFWTREMILENYSF